MSLHEEVKEAIIMALSGHAMTQTVGAIRAGATAATDGVIADQLATTNAVLEVIDTYKEVTARRNNRNSCLCYLPGTTSHKSGRGEMFTIYMKKEKEPAPTVEELSQAVVDAYFKNNGEFVAAMDALNDRLKP